jgi:hypothetical protein
MSPFFAINSFLLKLYGLPGDELKYYTKEICQFTFKTKNFVCEAGGNNSYLYNSIGTEQACTYAISNNSKLLSKNQEASKSLALR